MTCKKGQSVLTITQQITAGTNLAFIVFATYAMLLFAMRARESHKAKDWGVASFHLAISLVAFSGMSQRTWWLPWYWGVAIDFLNENSWITTVFLGIGVVGYALHMRPRLEAQYGQHWPLYCALIATASFLAGAFAPALYAFASS